MFLLMFVGQQIRTALADVFVSRLDTNLNIVPNSTSVRCPLISIRSALVLVERWSDI